MTRIALIGAASAALLLGGCSYSSETNLLGYHSSTSFSTPGAAPGYYAAPPAPAPAYTEAPPPPPAYAPAPAYYAPPAYYGPYIGIGIGSRWGWGRHRRW